MQLTDEEWLRIFDEADSLGISFILLAGGEPMIRRDIIEAAGTHPNILFPVFTNGTFMDDQYFLLGVFPENALRPGLQGCFFVEFVPATDDSKELAPGEADRECPGIWSAVLGRAKADVVMVTER